MSYIDSNPLSGTSLKSTAHGLALFDGQGRDVTQKLTDPKHGRMPDFLIVGMEKCGTTWLSACLDEHPGAFVLPFEGNYFNHYPDQPPTEYRKLFSPARPHQIVGEKTPSYAAFGRFPRAMTMIRDLMPDVKIILCLRDPVERSISAGRYHHKLGGIKLDLDHFQENFVQNGKINPDIVDTALVEESLYAPTIRRLRKLFPAENILTWFMEDDIKTNPFETLQKTFTFLGIDPDFAPQNARALRNVNFDIPFDASPAIKAVLYDYFAADMEETFALLGRRAITWEKAAASARAARELNRQEDGITRIKLLTLSLTEEEALDVIQQMIASDKSALAIHVLQWLVKMFPNNARARQLISQIAA